MFFRPSQSNLMGTNLHKSAKMQRQLAKMFPEMVIFWLFVVIPVNSISIGSLEIILQQTQPKGILHLTDEQTLQRKDQVKKHPIHKPNRSFFPWPVKLPWNAWRLSNKYSLLNRTKCRCQFLAKNGPVSDAKLTGTFWKSKSALFSDPKNSARPVKSVRGEHFTMVFTTIFQQVNLDQIFLLPACWNHQWSGPKNSIRNTPRFSTLLFLCRVVFFQLFNHFFFKPRDLGNNMIFFWTYKFRGRTF